MDKRVWFHLDWMVGLVFLGLDGWVGFSRIGWFWFFSGFGYVVAVI
jgi:hypothetical protein